jgi:hypothetical protein
MSVALVNAIGLTIIALIKTVFAVWIFLDWRKTK